MCRDEAERLWALFIWLEKPVRIFRQMYTVKARKREYLERYYLFFRKHPPLMNRSIWILPGIPRNSIQMDSAPFLTNPSWIEPIEIQDNVEHGKMCWNQSQSRFTLSSDWLRVWREILSHLLRIAGQIQMKKEVSFSYFLALFREKFRFPAKTFLA